VHILYTVTIIICKLTRVEWQKYHDVCLSDHISKTTCSSFKKFSLHCLGQWQLSHWVRKVAYLVPVASQNKLGGWGRPSGIKMGGRWKWVSDWWPSRLSVCLPPLSSLHNKVQQKFILLAPAHLGSSGKRPVKWCVSRAMAWSDDDSGVCYILSVLWMAPMARSIEGRTVLGIK